MVFEKVEEVDLKSPRCKACKRAVEIIRKKHRYVVKKGVKILNKIEKCPYCGKKQYIPIIFENKDGAEERRFLVTFAGLKKNLERFM